MFLAKQIQLHKLSSRKKMELREYIKEYLKSIFLSLHDEVCEAELVKQS
jgi:hypothetical protein